MTRLRGGRAATRAALIAGAAAVLTLGLSDAGRHDGAALTAPLVGVAAVAGTTAG